MHRRRFIGEEAGGRGGRRGGTKRSRVDLHGGDLNRLGAPDQLREGGRVAVKRLSEFAPVSASEALEGGQRADPHLPLLLYLPLIAERGVRYELARIGGGGDGGDLTEGGVASHGRLEVVI